MTTRKVQNPNSKGGAGFIWAIVAVIAIAVLVIGIIVYNGKSDRKDAIAEGMIDTEGISATWNEGDAFIALTGEGAEGAPKADLFEDFSCSHCADLETETGEPMMEALKAGEIEVDLRPMVFLDGQQQAYSPGHSTASLAATLALFARGETDAAMNLRYYLFENQAEAYNKFEADDLADLAKDYGASDEALQDIRDEKYAEAAKEMSDANLKLQEERTGEGWTPRVMVDDKDIDGDLGQWVETLKASK
ncbi:thioredoxin domain-containing protein [Corynebacterium sp. HMSC074A01]|uniref:DsbA family protein n=1 Tax=Corynebacterium sp. HMSC074A01 TaxID=1715030 RepID=UPI0008A29C03|nr:thioredoxin domain-containing protein [Corynebacterium sp. HMSC074A01]OHF36876.1 hypothetical protein HMPREF2550_05620 [Corynebacterium sp. HMSC074A01]